MIETKELVLKLKEEQQKRHLSVNDILDLTNNHVSATTIRRVIFTDGSENSSFRYEDTLRPLVKALLDMDAIEDTDNMDTKAMKSLLKLKIQRIEELEKQLAEEKIKNHEKMEKEREQYERHIKLLDEQIAKKDARMDEMKAQFIHKDDEYMKLVEKFLNCHCCDRGK